MGVSGRRGGNCAKHGPWVTQKRCPGCNKEQHSAWAAANREHVRRYVKARRDADIDTRRAQERGYAQSLKAEVITQYGGRCVCCGVADLVFLTIDHPDGNGAAHRRELFGESIGRAGERFYRWLRRNDWPPGYRVLCWNCQHATFRGVCPHQHV